MSYHETLTEDTIDAILEWFTVERSNMAALKTFEPDVRRPPPPHAFGTFGFGQAVDPQDVLAIGQSQFLVPARGIIWNCRWVPLTSTPT
jgi:hypothetical protein